MSKLSFRARALDANKPMLIYMCEEIPDLADFTSINRAVPQMPTGMEKEEESEHHLQRALSAQQVYGTASEGFAIPVPDVEEDMDVYEKIYKSDFQRAKQYIHVQPFALDQDVPDYDMDTDDEEWLNEGVAKKMDLTPDKFETMLDRLEKGSGQTVITLPEAKALLKEDDDLIIAVYDYWLNKRLKFQCPLIPQVKTERGHNTNNPYVAFRRRSEKMQTRKNRKNDETSYEKMLILQRDLQKAEKIMEFIKRREKSKRELLHLNIEIFEKRFQLKDYDGLVMKEVTALTQKMTRPSFMNVTNQYDFNWVSKDESSAPKEKRKYTKRRKRSQLPSETIDVTYTDADMDIEALSPEFASQSDEDECKNEPDGYWTFRRKQGCQYYAPLEKGGNWPWFSSEDGGLADRKYRFTCVSVRRPNQRFVGFCRRRMGRGGRVILDRVSTNYDSHINQETLPNGLSNGTCLHFRPKTPPPLLSAATMASGGATLFSGSSNPSASGSFLASSAASQAPTATYACSSGTASPLVASRSPSPSTHTGDQDQQQLPQAGTASRSASSQMTHPLSQSWPSATALGAAVAGQRSSAQHTTDHDYAGPSAGATGHATADWSGGVPGNSAAAGMTTTSKAGPNGAAAASSSSSVTATNLAEHGLGGSAVHLTIAGNGNSGSPRVTVTTLISGSSSAAGSGSGINAGAGLPAGTAAASSTTTSLAAAMNGPKRARDSLLLNNNNNNNSNSGGSSQSTAATLVKILEDNHESTRAATKLSTRRHSDDPGKLQSLKSEIT